MSVGSCTNALPGPVSHCLDSRVAKGSLVTGVVVSILAAIGGALALVVLLANCGQSMSFLSHLGVVGTPGAIAMTSGGSLLATLGIALLILKGREGKPQVKTEEENPLIPNVPPIIPNPSESLGEQYVVLTDVSAKNFVQSLKVGQFGVYCIIENGIRLARIASKLDEHTAPQLIKEEEAKVLNANWTLEKALTELKALKKPNSEDPLYTEETYKPSV